MSSVAFWPNWGSLLNAWQAVDCSRGMEQHLKMLFLPAYVVCIVEPPANEHPRSVSHGSVHNELVGRLCMMQLVREGFEMSTVTICTRSAVWSEASEDQLKQQCLMLLCFFVLVMSRAAAFYTLWSMVIRWSEIRQFPLSRRDVT